MLGSRTIKTLTALLITMTIGAFSLMVLETAPLQSPTPALEAMVASPSGQQAMAIRDTVVPIQPIKWRNVIVHSTAEGADMAQRCHFIVAADGTVTPGSLWRRQLAGHHVYVPGRDFNADSIGICVEGDFSQYRPTQVQMDSLVALTQGLQTMLSIPSDRIYLLRDLDATTASPGESFPAAAYNRSLYRSY
jgi:hypothetical protein